MKDSDMQAFFEMWSSAAEMYGKTVTENTLVMAYRLLSKFELGEIQKALEAHMLDSSSGQFMPKPADVVRKITGELPKASEIVGLARAANTPVGCFARMKIGKWDLDNQDSFYLGQRGEEIKLLLPDFIQRARSGRYTDHEIRLMKRYNVNLGSELCPGLPGPSKATSAVIHERAKALPEFVPTENVPTDASGERVGSLQLVSFDKKND